MIEREREEEVRRIREEEAAERAAEEVTSPSQTHLQSRWPAKEGSRAEYRLVEIRRLGRGPWKRGQRWRSGSGGQNR
jgi:hypothetical protein